MMDDLKGCSLADARRAGDERPYPRDYTSGSAIDLRPVIATKF
jgi:hypothetical protein